MNWILSITPFVRLYAQWFAWRLQSQKPTAVQQGQLLSLVRRAAATRFGRDHGFAKIKSVADFQNRVPLRSYDDFWQLYWQEDFPHLDNCTWPGSIPYFARTSGTTTGITKYIPCSREMMRANGRAAGMVVLHHLLNRPASLIFGGKTLMLGGSTDLQEEATRVLSGDLSGIAANEAPWWARPFTFPPLEVALLVDWERKIDRMVRLSLTEDIRAISGTPNWLLAFIEKLAELRPGVDERIANYFPDLELVVHGGIDFKPYAARFSSLLADSRAELREVYPASEAFIAIADRGPGEGLRLLMDNGVFFEFVPTGELGAPAPTRHWLATVETGVEYAIVLSTCAGAWGYILGDTIRFVEIDPPRILVTGRTSYTLSASGEHLINAEIEEAVAVAAASVGSSVVDYCVAPFFPIPGGSKAGHQYMVEFSEGPLSAKQLDEFRDKLDSHLSALNADYEEHRVGDFGLLPPRVETLGRGAFRDWMNKRGKLGGQHKVPRIVNDANLFADLQAFVSQSRSRRRACET